MGTISKPNEFTSGTTILSAEVNSNFDTIYNEFNGSITDTNISESAAIAASKISGTAVTLGATETITGDKTFTGAFTTDEVQLPEVVSAPSTAASEGALYTKDTGGQPELFYREESDGDEVQITDAGGLNSKIVQVVNTQDGAVATGTTTIPDDDTIPQNTEGDEYMTLAITPTDASNDLKIDVVVFLSTSKTATSRLTVALFQDATASALAAGRHDEENDDLKLKSVKFTHYMAAGTASATTFKVRAGCDGAGTTTFNGVSAGRKLGGVMASSITITEIKV